ncbi:hypothetical protein [Rhizobium sp. CF080]|uniref:hypothetical protein n=1 Tax=Rhizobium sp. (strain CF080) TaxID=1144310 RepID=UPI0012DF890C|nr:hypothetical protein [Rhizobium sp. CF080]
MNLFSWAFVFDAFWKFSVAVTASLALVGGAGVYRAVVNLVYQRWFGNLRYYEGDYYAYRWHVETTGTLVEPTVSIRRYWKHFWAYTLHWTTPAGTTESYRLKEHHGREIYATGESKGLGSHSTFILHPAHAVPVKVVSGMYFFMNTSHQFVAGPFLMSRRKLSREEVEALLKPSAATSSQYEAQVRYWAFEKMENAGTNVITLRDGHVPNGSKDTT